MDIFDIYNVTLKSNESRRGDCSTSAVHVSVRNECVVRVVVWSRSSRCDDRTAAVPCDSAFLHRPTVCWCCVHDNMEVYAVLLQVCVVGNDRERV